MDKSLLFGIMFFIVFLDIEVDILRNILPTKEKYVIFPSSVEL